MKKRFYIVFFIMVITIPLFLGVNAYQANVCDEIRRDIKGVERLQENSIENSRIISAEIADLMTVERLENEAKNNLGYRKMRPEEIRLIILGGGKGFEL